MKSYVTIITPTINNRVYLFIYYAKFYLVRLNILRKFKIYFLKLVFKRVIVPFKRVVE